MRNPKPPGMRSESGFTIIEFLVVAAIVGIFAVVAVPQYNVHMARARQGEVKIALTSAFTALRSFVVGSGSYTICLREIGVRPTGTQRYYAAGFATGASTIGAFFAFDSAGVGIPGRECTTSLSAAPSSNIPIDATMAFNAPSPTVIGLVNNLTTVTSVAPTQVGTNTFLLGGVGRIWSGTHLSGQPAHNDAWTLDQSKVLTNVKDGINGDAPSGPPAF